MRTHLVLLVSALALCGCYSYSVISPIEAAPGARVRARISVTEAARLQEVLNRDDRLLEGRVVASDDAGLMIQVPTSVSTMGTSTRWLDQRVQIPQSELLELELRRLDPWRTAGATAAVVAVVGFAAVEAFASLGGPSGDGNKGGVDNYLGLGVRLPR